jgi:outer membrane receptor protein involved in Fe transport
MSIRTLVLLTAFSLASALASAQTSGEIQGTVQDAQGLAIPGVTVTLSGDAVLGQQTAVTLQDGTYRFRGLRRGSYDLRFELQGFSALNRAGIIVEGNRTFTVNVLLEVATVSETVTVTGESPVVDVRNTSLSNEFGTEELHDVPSATDVWAVLGQTPGVRMRGYDVGGSHKSQQTAYESFGIRNQNRVLADGVDTTEGESGTGFYFDYYSIEEFTTAAAGSDVEMTAPGSLVVMTMKSGGNDFSGLVHADYEGESFVSDNIDEETASRGFTGNPNLLFWETHVDVGGPIVRDKAWFYGFYNHFRIDKQISGVDPEIATDLGDFDQFGGKLTVQLSQKDQFLGYTNYQLKEKPTRNLSTLIGPDSILAQASWSWAHKAEWQRVWNEKAFSTVAVKHFGFGWPMVPAVDPATNPPRYDQATQVATGAGWNTGGLTGSAPFTFERWKPQITATLNYYVPAAAGSHDFKFGYDWQIDSRQFGSNSNSGLIRYFDDSTLGRPMNVDEITLFNMPENGQIEADSRNQHHDLFVQDTWTLNDRLTLNLGLRYGRQETYFLDSESTPGFDEFFPTGITEGRTLVTWNTFAPRLGATYDLTGEGKTVLKAHYGRYYVNLADAHRRADPANEAWIRYDFLDQNENGLYDGAAELGTVRATSGATGTELRALGTPVNPEMEKEFADELSFSAEHQIAPDTSLRVSYVYKHLNADSGQWNIPQQLALLEGRGIPCGDAAFPCPLDALTGEPIRVERVPDDVANVVRTATDTFPGMEGDYSTVQVALSRRFRSSFFIQGSFDYQWRDEFRSATNEATQPLTADPLDVGSDGHDTIWQNHSLDVPFRQENTNWGARLLARYVFPREIALSGNIRHQSGWPWAPTQSVSVPGTGSVRVFLDDIANRRSDNVTIADVRLEKGFAFGNGQKLTGMIDVYNLFNSNAVTNFNLRTGSRFEEIIAVVDPRALKIGVRYQF